LPLAGGAHIAKIVSRFKSWIDMKISACFDSGNIIARQCDDPANIKLEIRKDHQSEFYQWFHFRLTGGKDQDCCLQIAGLADSAYPPGWKDYRVVVSYDRENWFRMATSFDGEQLTIKIKPEYDSVYFAYFVPYSMDRHADLIAAAQCSPRTQLLVPGSTLDGQDIDLLKIGNDEQGKRVFWVIARQHPGESMAEWWMEGFLERLLDPDDPVSRELLNRAVFYVVPNMNPDGSKRGHLRTNACGANLNREWKDPSEERSPEVFTIREQMRKTGVDFCLDVHGDENLPYNFIAAAEGIPSWSERQANLTADYLSALKQASPDFQTEFGYPLDEPGQADLSMCNNHVAEAFDCLSMTLEMPFKDNANAPDLEQGWSPERCRLFGAANLEAMYALIDDLR
jgi:murein tripeptide amidase MpaA